jgi:hypothetical protein
MICGPYGGCAGSDIIVAPVCLNGVWSCAMIVPIICPVDAAIDGSQPPRDAGPRDAATGVGRDAASGCVWPVIDAGGYFNCGICNSDSTPLPTCLDGAWNCPTGSGGPTVCPPMVRRCLGPQPSGCFCNPITGVLTCTHDAGADAPSD